MKYVALSFSLTLAGCGLLPPVEVAPENAPAGSIEGPPPPPPDARTVEDFDTTTAEERAAATATSSGGQSLGQVVASLGDAGAPGFWVETDLVDSVTQGRVTYGGRTVEVELRPVEGSTRLSLATMRLLQAPLTELVTIGVFKN